jgi:uncharacterized protein with PIN domain
MAQAFFRFYAELNDFLPAQRRQTDFVHSFRGRVSVKDMIESLGVPHTEVDLILADGRSVDFAYLVRDGDRVSVYPVFEALDISPAIRLRPLPLREARFILDVHLGRLAAYLRLLGFDTLYSTDASDDSLAQNASAEKRILLTRDRGLLKRGIVDRGYCVRHAEPRRQLAEVVRRFDLSGNLRPFRRCLRCNGLLRPTAKEAIADRLPRGTLRHYDDFRVCDGCGHVYWKGPHYRRMLGIVEEIRCLSNEGESEEGAHEAGG